MTSCDKSSTVFGSFIVFSPNHLASHALNLSVNSSIRSVHQTGSLRTKFIEFCGKVGMCGCMGMSAETWLPICGKPDFLNGA